MVMRAGFRRGQQRRGTELLVEPAFFRVSGGNDQDGRLQESRRVSKSGLIVNLITDTESTEIQFPAQHALTYVRRQSLKKW